MGAHVVVLGTFPKSGIVNFHEISISGAGAEPGSKRGCDRDRRWTGMLLAAAVPLHLGSFGQACRPVTPDLSFGPRFNRRPQIRGPIGAGIIV